MKTHTSIQHILTFAVVLIGCQASTLASVVFNFGPSTNYVESDTNFSRNATRSGSGPWTYLNAFSDTNALSPASAYTGPKFYGGYTLTSSSVQGSSLAGAILNNWSLVGNVDALRIYANISTGWAESELNFASVYLFKQEDFDSPFSSGDFKLEGLSVRYRASGADGAFLPDGRWLVEVEGQYYLSQATIAAAYNTTTTVAIGEEALNATQWALYNPSSSLFFSGVGFSSLDLSKVTAVGVYFEQTSYIGTSNTSAALLAISEFSASGTVIPEPSSAVLAAWGMLMGAALLGKRRVV